MDWVKPFYTKKSEWFSPTGILEYHRARAATIERLCGPGMKRILELGAGDGGTAAAMADLGYTVIAVELSPLRVEHAQELAKEPRKGSITILEADFYTVELEGKFDVVCYWDGFGVGSDADQRRLLQRVSTDWLASDGCMLLDVYNPLPWISIAGREKRVEGLIELQRRNDFDPIRCRFIDQWWPASHKTQAITQSLRCYTPVDFVLLLEGTGLVLHSIEVAGKALDVEAIEVGDSAMQNLLWSWEGRRYVAKLIAMSGAGMGS